MKAIDLANNKVSRTVLKLTIPAMLAQLVNVLYSIVDRMYVGNIDGIGDVALTALGVCAPIATLLSSFGYLVGLGGAPLFAMSMGEGNEKKAKQIQANAFVMLIALAIVISGLTIIFIKPLLMTFGASQSTYEYAKSYMTVYALGTIFSILAIGMNQYIIAQGYSGIGMATTLLGAVANIILDPVFIFALNMDVVGAAIATVISQFMSCAFVLIFLLYKGTKVRLGFGGYSVGLMGKIIKLGISPFLIIATDSLIIIISNMAIKKYGGSDADAWISSFTITQAFFSLIINPMLGISTGSQPVLSFNYGAKNISLIKRAEKHILSMCLVFTTAMCALSFVIAKPFVGLFTQNSQIIEYSLWGIRIFMIGIIPLSFQYAFVDGMTALGQPQISIVLSMTRKLVLYLGATILLPMLIGVKAVMYAQPIADVCGSALSTIVFLIFFPKVLKKREAMPLNLDETDNPKDKNDKNDIDITEQKDTADSENDTNAKQNNN